MGVDTCGRGDGGGGLGRAPSEGHVPTPFPEAHSSPPPPPLPALRLFTEQTAKEGRVPVFIPFTHSCPPAPAPPHFPALFFPPPRNQTPLHGISKPLITNLCGLKKSLLETMNPWEGEDGSRDSAPSLWVPSFLESEGPPTSGGGCTAIQDPSWGSSSHSQWWEDPFPSLGLRFWFLGQVVLEEGVGRIHKFSSRAIGSPRPQHPLPKL